ncbi:type II toxin-antitoxin system HicA family toxin [Amycolatopsis sp. Hca4]|nr:type II toxin-antitoxin system HicA family toxin [Amycolatopsis sp. Hca4]
MGGPDFPSMRGRELLRHLQRQPLSYTEGPSKGSGGSHRLLTSDQFPTLLFAFHDGAEIPPGLVRKIFTKDIGLTKDEALKHLRGDLQWPRS